MYTPNGKTEVAEEIRVGDAANSQQPGEKI